METTVHRTPITFNLRTDLVNILLKEAQKESLPVETLVENALLGISFDTPNRETAEAIEELKAGKYAGTLDVSSLSLFLKSIDSME